MESPMCKVYERRWRIKSGGLLAATGIVLMRTPKGKRPVAELTLVDSNVKAVVADFLNWISPPKQQ